MKLLPIAFLLLLTAIPAPPARAQRGMGNITGVARSGQKPQLEQVAGTIREITTGPCERTTGRALVGTHLILETRDRGELNLHLGSAQAVESFIEKLQVGDRVAAEGFRTPELNQHTLIARTIESGGQTLRLRDEHLRPVWAGSIGKRDGNRNGKPNRRPRGVGPGSCRR